MSVLAKYLMLIFTLTLMACSNDGNDNPQAAADTGIPSGISPMCKNLYARWQSTMDAEAWDFTSLYAGQVNPDYSFTAYDGATCGYDTNPNHAVTAQIVPGANGTWQLNLHASLALTGQCAYYAAPGSGNYQAIIIKMLGCGEIQICQNYGAGNCKTFR